MNLAPDQQRPRYYVKTMKYHVWAVMMRDDANLPADQVPCSDLDAVVEWCGAKDHGGDKGAREYAQTRAATLNRQIKKAG